jgi:Mg-chelatase subunit ChlD
MFIPVGLRTLVSALVVIFLTVSTAWASPSLKAPAAAEIGAEIQIQISGSSNPRDFVTIVSKGTAEGKYNDYEYAQRPTVKLSVPAAPGDYEIRLLGAESPYPTLTRLPLKANSVTVKLEAPDRVDAGSNIQVKWTGPNNERDYVAIGSASQRYIVYEYTRNANPVTLEVPDSQGEYELRYFLGVDDKVVGTRKLIVGGVSASVQAPAEAVAGSTFNVTWTGPNNSRDYITIVPKGSPEGRYTDYSYSDKGSPAKLIAPLAAGEYEVWYATGQSNATLARTNIRITPSKQEPGKVQVSATDAFSAGGGIEIILDASGSMLQKIGGQRRIDIAKQTLAKLTSTTIPAGTPFALRVFGREVNSCQTDLDIPVRPLDAAAVASKINALEAKNNAKTPIGASLEKVTSDLASVKGERLIVLLTDGEETCDGDPAAAIAALKKAGITVRVNIVGFAIDDEKLAGTFRHWAELGNGSYFDAKDATGLSQALTQSLRSSYEVVNSQGRVIASGITGGDPLSLLPGTYTVRLKGQPTRAQTVKIEPKTTASVKL